MHKSMFQNFHINIGESVLVCKQNELERAKHIMTSSDELVKSTIDLVTVKVENPEIPFQLKRAILEVILKHRIIGKKSFSL